MTRMGNVLLSDFIDECSLGKKSKDEIFEDLSSMNRENIHEIFKYKKFGYDFADYLSIYTDKDNEIIGKICPCYDEFLCSVLRFLNIKADKLSDEDKLTKLMKERIEVLRNIKTEGELRDEFPIIFKDLVQGRAYIDQVDLMDKNDPKTKEKRDYYYSCALKRNLNNFLKTQVELYTRFVENRSEFKKLIESKDYTDYIKENFDMDKVRMFIINLYLRICEKTNNVLVINKYMRPIEEYKFGPYNKRCVIHDQGDKVFDADIEYRTLLMKGKLFDLKHVSLNVELSPSSKLKRVQKKAESRILPINLEEMNRLSKIGEEKTKFYKSLPDVLIITGLSGHRGYVARVYQNGEVIMDRSYNPDHPSTATGAAIHNFKIGDFETLYKLDTHELKNHPKTVWIPHRDGWEDKVREIVNREATKEDIEDLNKFMQKIKGKN